MPTMTVTFVEFPFGTILPNTPTLSIPFTPPVGSPPPKGDLKAPAEVLGTAPAPNWAFGYWNINGQLYLAADTQFDLPSDNFSATAWYFAEAGTPQADVFTYAFSLDHNKVMAATPIASVTPPGAWAGPPSAIVATDTSAAPVVVTAASLVSGAGMFSSWMEPGNGTIPGDTITAAPNSDVQAIAFYAYPRPDPCADLRTELENLVPGDFPTPAMYHRAFTQLSNQVKACAAKYGE